MNTLPPEIAKGKQIVMEGLRKFKLDSSASLATAHIVNDNHANGDIERGLKLTALLIDVSGIIQNEFIASKCGRQADMILDFRYLLGEIFNIPVIEMDTAELKLDIAKQIQQL